MRGGLVRLTIGFASRVAAGKERGSAARPFRAQLVQRFGKNSARKPRYPTTRASFRRVIAGCFSVVGRIPRSGPRSIRGQRTARAFPVGHLGFRAKICLEGCTFSGRYPLHSLSRQACPRALDAVPAISGVRPIVGGLHSQRRSRTLGERSKCVQDAILAGFPHRAENRTRT